MDTYGVKCNVRAQHRFLRFGALCWVSLPNMGNGGERILVTGMSRGGRIVSTYASARDLHNYRPGWIHDLSVYKRIPFGSREEAQAWADWMNATYGDGPVREHAAAFGRL